MSTNRDKETSAKTEVFYFKEKNMIKTFHGRTNFQKLHDFIVKAEQNKRETFFEYMDDVMSITPLGKSEYIMCFKNDTIHFYADFVELSIVPLHVTNILDDVDQSTMVTGTDIPKRYALIKADERLYNICKHCLFVVCRIRL